MGAREVGRSVSVVGGIFFAARGGVGGGVFARACVTRRNFFFFYFGRTDGLRLRMMLESGVAAALCCDLQVQGCGVCGLVEGPETAAAAAVWEGRVCGADEIKVESIRYPVPPRPPHGPFVRNGVLIQG